MKKEYRRYLLEILFFLIIVAIDLVTKEIAFDLLENYPTQSYVVLEDMFTLIIARNNGASFSIMSDQQIFLKVFPLIAIAAIIALLVIRPNTPHNLRFGAILIAGGALGNVIDRIALGYVRDFIDYTFLKTMFNIDFAIGNVADLFLCVGVVVLITYIIFQFDERDFYSKKKLEELLKKENNE